MSAPVAPVAAAEPLRATTFTLTAADALAYENLPRPFTAAGKLLLVVWLALGGAAAALLPDSLTGGRGWGFWLIGALLVGIQLVLAMLWYTWRSLRRARHRIPRPIELTLLEWPDHLSVSGAGLPRDIPYAGVTEFVPTPAHLFLRTPTELLIVPRRGFVEPEALDEIAARLRAARPVDPAPPSA